MAEELFFKVEELLSKQDVQKLKLFAAILCIDGEQIKKSRGRRDVKFIIIKVLEGKLGEEGKTDKQECDILKQMIEDFKFCNGDHVRTQIDQKEDGKKNAIYSNAGNDG